MKIAKKMASLGMAGVLFLTIAGCNSDIEDVSPTITPTPVETVEPDVSESPSAEPTQGEEADLDSGNPWGFDSSSIQLPEDVIDVFGDDAYTVVDDALTAIHESYLQSPHLLVPGWTQEEYDIAWEGWAQTWTTGAIRDDESLEDNRSVLFRAIPREGNLGTIDGVEYVMPADGGVDARLITEPRVLLAPEGDAVTVRFDLSLVYLSSPSHATSESHVSLTMIPVGEGGHWMIDGFSIIIDPFEAVEG